MLHSTGTLTVRGTCRRSSKPCWVSNDWAVHCPQGVFATTSLWPCCQCRGPPFGRAAAVHAPPPPIVVLFHNSFCTRPP